MSSVKAQPIPEIMVAIMMPLRRVRLMRGPVVIAQNRLHSLSDAEHYHYEEHRGAVYYAVGSHGEVAVGSRCVEQRFVYEYHHQAGAAVHQKR